MRSPPVELRPGLRPPRPISYVTFLALLWSLSFLPPAVAQIPRVLDPPPSADAVQEKLEAVDGLAGRDDAAKAALKEAYQRALASLTAAREHEQKIAEFQKAIDEAPSQLASIKDELARPAGEVKVDPPKDATVSQLEQQLKQAQAELDAARGQVSELAAESTSRKNRRTDLPEALVAVKRRLEEWTIPPATGADATLDEASRIAARAQRHALQMELTRYEKELASYDARADLLPARRDRAQRRVADAETRAQEWRRIVDEARARETQRALDEARRRELEAEELKPLAEVNTALAAEGSTITDDMKEAAALLSERKKKLDALTRRFQSTREKILLAGLTDAMSVLLRKEHADLEVTDGFKREQRLRRERISDAQLRELQLDDDRQDLSDADARAREAVASIDPTGERADRANLEAAARELLEQRKTTLESLKADYRSYLERLVELERTTETYAAASDEYRDYLQERIFSVRSVDGSWIPSLGAFAEAGASLFGPATWSGTLDRLASALAVLPAGTMAAGVGLLLLLGLSLLLRPRFRAAIRNANTQVRRVKTDAFKHTAVAFLGTVVLALPLALVLLLVGGALELAAEPKGVVGALGSTLVLLSSVVFLLELVRQAARREGLGGAHFQWADVTCKSLGQLVRRFAPLYVVSLCVALVMQPPAVTDRENDSLGRVAFAVAMIALFLFLKRLLDPAGPVVSTLTSRSPSSIIVRFRHAWYALAVTVPSSLLLLTVVGYDFTATEIHSRVRISLQFLVILAFAYALAMRWLDVARRRLAIEHARLRREAARATAKTADEPKDSMPAVEEVNLPAMSAQTTQLLRSGVLMVVAVGLWWTWAELVPALRVFDRVQIWPTLQVVEDRGEEGRYPVLDGLVATAQSAAPAASAPRAEAKPPPEPAASGAVPSNGLRPPLPTGGGEGTGDAAAAGALPSVLTLADLGLSILFLLLTTIAAKNIPGLVEIVLLRRLSIDPGARYAVSTIARYAIVILGVTLAFGALSIGWKNIQWLAAALTFGLAFGLQEIFANFVSGLIMLFERPVRIGDTISVGGVTGTVSRIRMRATTITDYENRELIVPNREFITSQLVNWTLTDSVTREVIKIGVAYGTDSERARDVLLAACRACPVVLDQPAPSVIFRTFGDSSLVFDIRVYMATRDHWARLMDDLMNRLYRACNEAGITIAFPQLDLHLKSGFPPVREEEEEAEEEEDGEGKVPGR